MSDFDVQKVRNHGNGFTLGAGPGLDYSGRMLLWAADEIETLRAKLDDIRNEMLTRGKECDRLVAGVKLARGWLAAEHWARTDAGDGLVQGHADEFSATARDAFASWVREEGIGT